MAQKFYVKNYVGSTWTQVTNFFVKTSLAGWSQVTDAWVKTGLSTWSKFYSALMAPDSPVELIESRTGTNNDTLRFQGKNYHWTPTPQSIKYYFRWVDGNGNTTYIGPGGIYGTTTSNPITSAILPSSTTYVTIDPTGTNYNKGQTNTYYFEVRATGASGTVYPSQSSTYATIISPKAPTLSYTAPTSTSITLTITCASNDDYYGTNRYIIYSTDSVSGTVNRGGFSVSYTTNVTFTGLTPGRQYMFYVLPVTGYTGTTTSNYSGYPGIEASISAQSAPALDPQPFTTIAFGKGTVNSSSQGAARTVTLYWNASTNATRYEVLYEGSNDNATWYTVQSFASASYLTTTNDSKLMSTNDSTYYTYYRAKVRASNPDSAVKVISDNDNYIYASGTAPGDPSFGSITAGETTASVPFTVGSAGSNYLYSSIEYQVRPYYSSYPGSWSTQAIVSGAGTISLTGLASGGVTYYIKIRTHNYDELYSNEVQTSFQTAIILSPPTGLSGYGNGSTDYQSITLNWNSVSGASSYELYYNGTGTTPSDSFGADYSGITSTSFTTPYQNFSANTTYYWWVRSVSSTGNKSTWSSRATITTNSNFLTTPSIYSISTSSTGGPVSVYFTGGGPYYQIYWYSSSTAPNYQVSPDGTGSSSPVTDPNGPTTTSTYYMYVRSVTSTSYLGVGPSALASSWSSGVAFTMTNPVPSTPTGLSATTNRSTDVLLTWNASSGATSYEIWYGSPPLDYYTPDFYPGANTYYFDTGIGQGSSRTYYVRARNASGVSAWSSGVTGTRTAPVSTPAPSGLTINLSYSGGPTWTGSWSASNATSYSWTFYTADNNSGTNQTYRSSGSGTSMSYSGGTQLWGKLYVTASNSSGSVSGESAWT